MKTLLIFPCLFSTLFYQGERSASPSISNTSDSSLPGFFATFKSTQMKILTVALFLFLMTAISWMDYRLTGQVHAALLLPAGLVTFAFSFVKEKKTSLFVLSMLILILSFSKRNTDSHQVSAKQKVSQLASVSAVR